MGVFDEGYANTCIYQLPLYTGSPTSALLKDMSLDSCLTWSQRNLQNGTVSLNLINTKHMYNICSMSDQRRRRWADVVQILYLCFVFAGNIQFSLPVTVAKVKEKSTVYEQRDTAVPRNTTEIETTGI